MVNRMGSFVVLEARFCIVPEGRAILRELEGTVVGEKFSSRVLGASEESISVGVLEIGSCNMLEVLSSIEVDGRGSFRVLEVKGSLGVLEL
jgi:hypothetical protein